MQPENIVNFNKEQFYFVHLFINIQSIHRSICEGTNNDKTIYLFKESQLKEKILIQNRYNNASGNTFETIDVIKVEVPNSNADFMLYGTLIRTTVGFTGYNNKKVNDIYRG